MHETLPCYLALEVGAKLAKCFRGHLRAPHAISCISCVLLYDWPSYLREQINRTFQFRNCHGKFFCSFWCIHGNNPRPVSVWEKWLHTKKSFPVGKRSLPMGKRASITTTIAFQLEASCLCCCVHSRKRKLAVFFPPSFTPLSTMLWSRASCNVAWAGYISEWF